MSGAPWRILRLGWLAAVALGVAACGGGGSKPASTSTPAPPSPPAAPNEVSVVVDGGPSTLSNPVANTLYTTVKICVPGSATQCQTIDHIQVDSGSYGLRLLSSVVTLNLPPAVDASGNALVECTIFVSSYSWGPVSKVDLTIGGEQAAGIPVQLVGASSFPTVPTDCSSLGMNQPQDTVESFGANGLLGIGVFAQDCGTNCVVATPAAYYSCTSSTCQSVGVPLSNQVLNPIPLFAKDNNGSFIVLPSVPAEGETTLTGSLIFGIDTESNNASGTQTILAVDLSGNFATVFNGQTLTQSFLDSGSNGLFFIDSGIKECPTTPPDTPLYCPATPVNLTATLTGTTTSPSVPFTIGNAKNFAPTYTVLPELGGTFSANMFDWGLPFFYGRRVATAIEGQTTAVSAGPYVAF